MIVVVPTGVRQLSQVAAENEQADCNQLRPGPLTLCLMLP